MGINNPVPRSLKNETKKAAKVLASFIKPNQMLGADMVIPPEILKNAKGLAILTVLKAGFLFSGRAGSGVIVARLPDGSWSPPSGIVTAGAGVGGQIGAELTDFVFILNTEKAVQSFAQAGSITLGGNISLAAGPLGRNAEAGGTASLKTAAAIFSYSKTKGLFAGVSLEGSVLIERREENRKFYGDNCTAKMILSGRVEAPPACDPLFRVLNSRVFSSEFEPYDDDDYYDDIPDSSDLDSTYSGSGGRRRSYATTGSARRGSRFDDYDDYDEDEEFSSAGRRRGSRANRSSSWQDDVYDQEPSRRRTGRHDDVDELADDFSRTHFKSTYSDKGYRPSEPKPKFGSSSQPPPRPPKGNEAVALYSFDGEQAGDLSFKKGDIITIVKKSDSVDDWWTGRCNGMEGIFPANYVKLR